MLAFLFTKIEKKPAAAAEPEAAAPEPAPEPEVAVAIAPWPTPSIHLNLPELDLGLANLDPAQKPQENPLLTFLYLASITKPEVSLPFLPPESQLDVELVMKEYKEASTRQENIRRKYYFKLQMLAFAQCLEANDGVICKYLCQEGGITNKIVGNIYDKHTPYKPVAEQPDEDGGMGFVLL